MKVVYKGQFDSVIIPAWVDANGYPQTASRGEPVDIDDELAKSLLEQEDNWAKPTAAVMRHIEPAAESGTTEE